MKAKIWNYKKWIKETRPQKLIEYFDNALTENGFLVLNTTEYYFDPYGYTRLYLLGESHFALHTFPEESKTYIEISSCNKEKYKSFKNMLKRSDING